MQLIRLYISGFVWASAIAGAQTTPTQIIDRAVAAYNAAGSMAVEFDQTLHNPLTGNRSNARGTLLRKKPNLLAITFTNPANNKIIADGKNVWVYLPSSAPGQVIKLGAEDLGSLDPASQFVSNPKSRYKIESTSSGSVNGRPAQVLVLTPKSSSANTSPFTRAKIWVDDNDASIRKFEVTETSGLVRTVTVRRLSVNSPVRGTSFQFRVPKGVRVVER